MESVSFQACDDVDAFRFLFEWRPAASPRHLFPALFISNKYSLRFPPLSFFFRAFRRLQIFPRFRPVAAFKDSHMFSRAFYLTRFGFELWLANTAACKASMDINFSDFAGVTLILITV